MKVHVWYYDDCGALQFDEMYTVYTIDQLIERIENIRKRDSFDYLIDICNEETQDNRMILSNLDFNN